MEDQERRLLRSHLVDEVSAEVEYWKMILALSRLCYESVVVLHRRLFDFLYYLPLNL